jgi:hypothetical protein
LNVADYLGRIYPSPPCWSLVTEVYIMELGQQVDAFGTISDSVRQAAQAFRLQLHKDALGFKRIMEPVDLCVVLMGKTRKLGFHHCGVYYGGSVLHAVQTEDVQQVLNQDLASLRDTYPLMEFWAR